MIISKTTTEKQSHHRRDVCCFLTPQNLNTFSHGEMATLLWAAYEQTSAVGVCYAPLTMLLLQFHPPFMLFNHVLNGKSRKLSKMNQKSNNKFADF